MRIQVSVFIGFVISLIIGCAEPYQPSYNTIFVSAINQQTGNGSYQNPFRDLQTAIDSAKSGDHLILLPGLYRASSSKFVEDLCGNCLEHRAQVDATKGFLIENKALTITGVDSDSVTLETNAGYGVLFLGSWGSTLEHCTITGGLRDRDGNATDAAVVAKFSKVKVANCRIINNEYRDTSVVVGIGGVFGREGSELFIENNYIFNNGWDGIALYRGAKAFIADNVIDEGRGAGIGITWDAEATVMRNRISHYWKGIGTFGASRAVVRNNIVQDCLGWGVIATGTSFMEATNNLIYRNGNCGFANWGDRAEKLGPRGVFANNIVYNNGWRDEWVCPCVGVWMLGNPNDFIVTNNNVYVDTVIREREKLNPTAKDHMKPKYKADYEEIASLIGELGNISIDPLFADTIKFKLLPASPLIDAGDSILTDLDGSRSDMGPWGGQSAWR